MAQGNDNSNKVSAEEYLSYIISNDLYNLHLHVIDHEITSDLLKFVEVNPDSFPGIMTEHYFGSSRFQTLPNTLVAAMELHDAVMQKPTKYCGLWKVLGREKDLKLTPEGVMKGTRPVLAPEEILTLIAGLYGQIITIGLRKIKDNPFFIGKSFENRSVESFFEGKAEFDFIINTDFVGFDTTVDRESMLCACAILRSLFPSSREYDRMWFFLATSLINKQVVFPPGIIYEINNGLPSGHPLTSLVGTLVNYIQWNRALTRAYGEKAVSSTRYLWKSQYCGDDARHLLVRVDKILDKINKIFKEEQPCIIEDVHDSISPLPSSLIGYNSKFLKRCSTYDGLVYWDHKSIIKKLMFPSRNFKSYFEIQDWIYNWIETAPFDYEMNKFLTDYLLYLLRDFYSETYKEIPFFKRRTLITEDLNDIIIRGYLRIQTNMKFFMLNIHRPVRRKVVSEMVSNVTPVNYPETQLILLTLGVDAFQILKRIDENALRHKILKVREQLIRRTRKPP
uniref:RNA-dependent RNA polymerase n=1 Tax=Amalga-like lacheneauvirus TaxID=2784739 RepID=A0A7S6YLE5_9VIRU|nr:RNA-dependent RNA polymerase [Amalga-like lacheneauvirus]